MRSIFAILLIVMAWNTFAQCTKDTDCKGDRICVNGECVDPIANTQLETITLTPNNTSTAIQESEYGWISVTLTPKDANLIIDNELLGPGDRKIKLKVGNHSVKIRNEKDEKTTTVRINAQDQKFLNLALEEKRNVYWGFSTDFAWAFGENVVIGPTHNVGIHFKNQYLGLNYTWGIGTPFNYGGYGGLFGGGAVYCYEMKIKDIFSAHQGF